MYAGHRPWGAQQISLVWTSGDLTLSLSLAASRKNCEKSIHPMSVLCWFNSTWLKRSYTLPLISGLRASLGIAVVQSLLTEISSCGFTPYFHYFFKKRTKWIAITGELLQPGRRIREHDSSSNLLFALEAPGQNSSTWGELSVCVSVCVWERELKSPSVQHGWMG